MNLPAKIWEDVHNIVKVKLFAANPSSVPTTAYIIKHKGFYIGISRDGRDIISAGFMQDNLLNDLMVSARNATLMFRDKISNNGLSKYIISGTNIHFSAVMDIVKIDDINFINSKDGIYIEYDNEYKNTILPYQLQIIGNTGSILFKKACSWYMHLPCNILVTPQCIMKKILCENHDAVL